MEMTEQCKKEIEQYVREKGWNNTSLFGGNKLIQSYFDYSPLGLRKGLVRQWKKDKEKMNKYLLEFIGHILRKHNITEINISGDSFPDDTSRYSSKEWKFNNISKI